MQKCGGDDEEAEEVEGGPEAEAAEDAEGGPGAEAAEDAEGGPEAEVTEDAEGSEGVGSSWNYSIQGDPQGPHMWTVWPPRHIRPPAGATVDVWTTSRTLVD